MRSGNQYLGRYLKLSARESHFDTVGESLGLLAWVSNLGERGTSAINVPVGRLGLGDGGENSGPILWVDNLGERGASASEVPAGRLGLRD